MRMGWCCAARHGGSGKKLAPLLPPPLLLLLVSSAPWPAPAPLVAASKPYAWNLYSQSAALVTPAPLLLPYHNGPVLSGGGEALEVHILWYGGFTAAQKGIVLDFLASFSAAGGGGDDSTTTSAAEVASSSPSGYHNSSSSGGSGNATAAGGGRWVSEWWSTTRAYRDASGAAVAPGFRVGRQAHDVAMSRGKTLTPRDVERLLFGGEGGGEGEGEGEGGGAQKKKKKKKTTTTTTTTTLPPPPSCSSSSSSSLSLRALFTAHDVYVDGFCLNSCGFHAYTFPGVDGRMMMMMQPYLWLGNSAAQCPGQCAWPFAAAHYGPQTPPLRPPNGDAGADGMVVVLATLLAGAATNPFGTGFFQGDASAPLEAASACSGIFGRGAFPGYPGHLLTHAPSGSSYNARGAAGRRFLLPAIWNPTSLNCLPL